MPKPAGDAAKASKGDPEWSLRKLTDRVAEEADLLRVAAEVRAGNAGSLDGVWGSAQAMGVAALCQKIDGLALVVDAHPGRLADLADDLRAFGGVRPVLFPQLEGEPASRGYAEAFGKRLRVIRLLGDPDPPKVIVASIHALQQPVPAPDRVEKSGRRLARAMRLGVDVLLLWLQKSGFIRRDAVEIAGEYSLRGGILDVFPIDATDPLRVEFFGDEIESLREFSVESQRSLRTLDHVFIVAADWSAGGVPDGEDKAAATVLLPDALPPKSWVALLEPLELNEEARAFVHRGSQAGRAVDHEAVNASLLRRPSVLVASLPVASAEVRCTLHTESVERLSGDVTKLSADLDQVIGDDRLLVCCHNEAEKKRLSEVLAGSRLLQEGRLHLQSGGLAKGFRWVAGKVVVTSDNELLQRTQVKRVAAKRSYAGKAIDSFLDLAPGDFVVHLGHGISIFRGMKMLDKNEQLEEHLMLEFADETFVYVPASKIDLVQKYVGGSAAAPKLSKVGGVGWERRKKQVEKAVQDFAAELIDVQAARAAQPGEAFPPDSTWMNEFEASFPYEETRDQLTSIAEIKKDMETAKPMDRLLCGDVGFGKTELAMRAAFKAIDSGKQVGVLAPTTVLAQQHLRTFRERMADFPFRVEAITRFETKAEQKKIVEDTKSGAVDVLIGTHRLTSQDVKFHELGLVIIDEEQRFGVDHKERLKKLRASVDVLTMTATPIPRTLHQSLLGIRDISNLETAPMDRIAVETRIARWDPTLLRHAIVRELNREGQIYFVHNRVKDLAVLERKLTEIIPELRVATIHGQMTEDKIEDGMLAFLEKRADLLLATTIIESGLDIPNANTIFINEGDQYGLADLHQLRGRVGRSTQRAYCYVLVDEHKLLRPEAQRRLKAIEEYSQLGAGFKIALRDLEIRGAGNILGLEQSGHIASIGYELYCSLLENAVRGLKKQPLRTHVDVTIELPWEAFFPPEWLPGERYRVDAYRRLSRIRDLTELEEFRQEMQDRFGEPPEPAENLLDVFELRLLAQIWQIEAIRPDEIGYLQLTYRDARRIRDLSELRPNQLIIADRKSALIRVKEEFRNAESYCRVLKRILQPS